MDLHRPVPNISSTPQPPGRHRMPEPRNAPNEPEVEHPQCKECGVPMWLVWLEPLKPDQVKGMFECKSCGATVTEVVKYK